MMSGDLVELSAWLSGHECRAELWLYSASHSRAELRLFGGGESRNVALLGVNQLAVRPGSSSGVVRVREVEGGVAIEGGDFLLVAASVHWLARLTSTVDAEWLRGLNGSQSGRGGRD